MNRFARLAAFWGWVLVAAFGGAKPTVLAQDVPAERAALRVRSSCGPGWSAGFRRALEVELTSSRRVAEPCREIRVVAQPASCEGTGATHLQIGVGGQSAVELEFSGNTLRALAMTAAEQIVRLQQHCVPEAPASEWEDPRPMATEVDRQLYYERTDLGREMSQRTAGGTVLVRARAAPFADVARGGFGLLGDASLSVWLADAVFVNADLGPLGVAVGDAPDIGALGGSISLGYDAGWLAVAIGGGLGVANGIGQADLLGRADFYLRIGIEPSLYASVRASLAFDADRVEFGHVAARFAVPLERRLALTWDADVAFAFASGRVDLGLQIWLLGDVASRSGLALEVGLGAGAVGFVPSCALGTCGDDWTVAAGPSGHLGVVMRAGP